MFNLVYLAGILPFVLGFLATYLAGLIRQDGWNRYVNEGLVGVFILIAAVGSALLNGKLTGNWSTDLEVLSATATALTGTTLRPLAVYLQSNVLTFAKPATPPQPAPRLNLNIPPRASRVTQATTITTSGPSTSGNPDISG